MRFKQLCGRVITIAAMFLLVVTTAHADARYTTEMLVHGHAGGPGPQITRTVEIKGHRERDVTTTAMGPMHMKRVTITMCDLHQTVDIDDELRIYSVEATSPLSRIPGMAKMNHPHERGAGGGHVVMTSKVVDHGPEMVGKYHTRHYTVTMHIVSTGCAGNNNTTMTYDLWVAPGHLVGLNCPQASQPTTQVDNHGCKITYEMKGDYLELASIERNLPVQTIFRTPQGQMIMRLTDFSQAPLNASDFTIPAGYRKVSQPQFQQAEQRAMMQRMMQRMHPGH